MNCPCYIQEYKYCSNILNPDSDIENDSYLIDICEIDEDDDISNIENWKKANPLRMSYEQGIEQLKESYKIAEDIPEKMIAFKTKCLNVWVQAKETGYMNMEKWKNCEVKEFPYEYKKRDIYVGFDMSAKVDLTSVAFIIPIIDKNIPKYIVFSHSFIPNRKKLMERIKIDKVPYDAWEEQGFLTVTNTPIVDQQRVMDYVEEECKKNEWKVKKLCFDPANASKLMMDLDKKGYSVVEVFQSHKSLNESTTDFREQVYLGNVYYKYNPLLNFAMGNAVIKQNNGLIKIDKDATTKRIDPVDAILGGFKLARYYEFEKDESKYSNKDYFKKIWGGEN